jgi:tol-pal system protein YbgF
LRDLGRDLFLGVVLVSALGGCATDEASRRAVADVAAMQSRLDATRVVTNTNARELAVIDARVRALESENARLSQDLRNATTRLTRVEAGAERAAAVTNSAASAAESRMPAAPPVTAPSPAPAMAPPKTAVTTPTAEVVAPATSPPPRSVTPSAVAPVAAPTPAAAMMAPKSAAPMPKTEVAASARPAAPADPAAEKLFARALAGFRAGEPGQAVLELTDFLGRFPRHERAPSAQWWVGEAYYQQRDFRQALVEFQRVVEQYPESPSVAEALVKIGLCHRALDDAARARAAWEQVTRDHPASDAAARARSLLAGRSAAPRATR